MIVSINEWLLTGADNKKTKGTAKTNSSHRHRHTQKWTDKISQCGGKVAHAREFNDEDAPVEKQPSETEIDEKYNLNNKANGTHDKTIKTKVTSSLKTKLTNSVANDSNRNDKLEFVSTEVSEENNSASQTISERINGEDEYEDKSGTIPILRLKLPKNRKSDIHDSKIKQNLCAYPTTERNQFVSCEPARHDKTREGKNTESCSDQKVIANNLDENDCTAYLDDLFDKNTFQTDKAAIEECLENLKETLSESALKTDKCEKEMAENTQPLPNEDNATKVDTNDNHEDGHHCNECGATFKYLKRFNQHKKDGACVFLCSYCDKKYTARFHSNYLRHLKYHVNDRQHVCSQCGKAFAEKCKLTFHLLSHSNQRSFVCDICGQAFNTSAILRSHIKNLHTERQKNFRCELCDKRFVKISNLNSHISITHNSNRPYKCGICQKTFKTRYAMEKVHMLLHDNRRPLLYCSLCPKSFRKKEYLNMHMKRHKNERTHFCDICKKGFYDNKTLREHYRVHSGVKPFSCSYCEYKCALKGNLTKHMKVHANEDVDDSDTDGTDELENETVIHGIGTTGQTLRNGRDAQLDENGFVDLNTIVNSDRMVIEKNVNRDPVLSQRQFSGQDSFSILSLLNRDVSNNSEVLNPCSNIVRDMSMSRKSDVTGKASKTGTVVTMIQNPIVMINNENSGPENELTNSLLMFSGLLRPENNFHDPAISNVPSASGIGYQKLQP